MRSFRLCGEDLVDAAREFEVLVGDAPGRVRRAGKGHLAPSDVNVRVMIQLLGHHSDFVDCGDGGPEGRQLRGTGDGLRVAGPALQAAQGFGDLFCGERLRHSRQSSAAEPVRGRNDLVSRYTRDHAVPVAPQSQITSRSWRMPAWWSEGTGTRSNAGEPSPVPSPNDPTVASRRLAGGV